MPGCEINVASSGDKRKCALGRSLILFGLELSASSALLERKPPHVLRCALQRCRLFVRHDPLEKLCYLELRPFVFAKIHG
jgi:hypothetical protein